MRMLKMEIDWQFVETEDTDDWNLNLISSIDLLDLLIYF
jgi:hypothetical protein